MSCWIALNNQFSGTSLFKEELIIASGSLKYNFFDKRYVCACKISRNDIEEGCECLILSPLGTSCLDMQDSVWIMQGNRKLEYIFDGSEKLYWDRFIIKFWLVKVSGPRWGEICYQVLIKIRYFLVLKIFEWQKNLQSNINLAFL